MIALPMQKASTMHTITSSRSPYGSCSFNVLLTRVRARGKFKFADKW